MTEPSDFNAMNLAEHKENICRNVKRIRLKTSHVEIASAVERMNGFANGSKLQKDQTNDADKSIIHDMLSHNPSSLKTVATSTRRRRLGCTYTTFLTIDFTTPLITTSTDSPLTSHLKIIAYFLDKTIQGGKSQRG